MFSHRTSQYAYFDKQLRGPNWRGKKILDFGGNIGGFLKGAAPCIDHDNYWCIDLYKPAIEYGQKTYPCAHFVFYDRYNCKDNPTGIVGLPLPDVGQTFDFILAFSVFTHTSTGEMLDLLDQLLARLNPSGVLAFTFFDPTYDPLEDPHYDLTVADSEVDKGSNVRHRLESRKVEFPHMDVGPLLAHATNARWCTLVGPEFRVEPEDSAAAVEQAGWSYIQFYTPPYLRSLLSHAWIFPPSVLRGNIVVC